MKKFITPTIIVFLVLISFMIQILMAKMKNDTEKESLEQQKWQAAGCPVYRGECGSKHKYSCERKAAVIGRNQVGDTFVEAYPLCAIK